MSPHPHIRFETFFMGDPQAGACHCQCQHVHLFAPGRCQGVADKGLWVDVTLLSPMTGDPENQQLRPFCQGCYDQVRHQEARDKKLKRLRRKLGV